MVKNLKKLRLEKGISQKALGNKISVSQQSINKYENHDVEPDIKTLIALSDFFQTSVDYLIGNTEIERIIEPLSKYDLNADEAALIDNYRQLSETEKNSIKLIVHNYNKNRS